MGQRSQQLTMDVAVDIHTGETLWEKDLMNPTATCSTTIRPSNVLEEL